MDYQVYEAASLGIELPPELTEAEKASWLFKGYLDEEDEEK
jgi:hypothetical protein